MDFLQSDPLPETCANCDEQDCCSCDYAADLWVLSAQDQLWLRRLKLTSAVKWLLELPVPPLPRIDRLKAELHELNNVLGNEL